jgi:hypothetical protein
LFAVPIKLNITFSESLIAEYFGRMMAKAQKWIEVPERMVQKHDPHLVEVAEREKSQK